MKTPTKLTIEDTWLWSAHIAQPSINATPDKSSQGMGCDDYTQSRVGDNKSNIDLEEPKGNVSNGIKYTYIRQ